MAGKGGGAWKVAYADFATAMMAFFLVMWITSQSTDIKEAVANHFQSPFGGFDVGGSLRPPPPKPHFEEETGTGNAVEPKPELEEQATTSRRPFRLRRDSGQRTDIGAVVAFPEESAELTEAAKREMQGLIPSLSGKPHRIEIRGHASRRPPAAGSPYQDAWQLSYARCLKAMEYLTENGIERERIRLSQAGPFESYDGQSELSHDPRASRVEIFVLSEMALDPRRRRESESESNAAAPQPRPSTGKPRKQHNRPLTDSAGCEMDWENFDKHLSGKCLCRSYQRRPEPLDSRRPPPPSSRRSGRGRASLTVMERP